jgi:FkbM family methyltransferase
LILPNRPACIRGHHILGACLPRGAVVLDAGAHRGEFSRRIRSQFGCRCYGLEPNPALFSALLDSDYESKACCALSGRDGTALFRLSENPEAGHLSGGNLSADPNLLSVETVSLETAMRRFGLDRIELLKLDIEGAEFQVLTESPSHVLQSIGQIAVEFHDFLPEWQGAGNVAGVRRRLKSLGFLCCQFSFRTHGDVLFVNTARHELSFLRRFYLRHVARFVEKAAGARAGGNASG